MPAANCAQAAAVGAAGALSADDLALARRSPCHLVIASDVDPDQRILKMLGARGTVVALEAGGEKEVLRC